MEICKIREIVDVATLIIVFVCASAVLWCYEANNVTGAATCIGLGGGIAILGIVIDSELRGRGA